MFTENVKPRKRGRPPGQTPQGAAARERLYATAIQLIAARGYEATTLRDVAKEAGVSVGLLYRYFPSKQAVVIALYDELSSNYSRQAADMPPGRWRERFIFALKTSLDVLKPHQVALRALTPVLVGDPEEGIFSASTAFSTAPRSAGFRAGCRRVERCTETADSRGARSASVPRSPGGTPVVAAGQEYKPARDGHPGIAYPATLAVCGADASCSAGSTLPDLCRRARS